MFILPDKDSIIYGCTEEFVVEFCKIYLRPQILIFIIPDKDSIIYCRIKVDSNKAVAASLSIPVAPNDEIGQGVQVHTAQWPDGQGDHGRRLRLLPKRWWLCGH